MQMHIDQFQVTILYESINYCYSQYIYAIHAIIFSRAFDVAKGGWKAAAKNMLMDVLNKDPGQMRPRERWPLLQPSMRIVVSSRLTCWQYGLF